LWLLIENIDALILLCKEKKVQKDTEILFTENYIDRAQSQVSYNLLTKAVALIREETKYGNCLTNGYTKQIRDQQL